jgi:sensor histidine kinase YesM
MYRIFLTVIFLFLFASCQTDIPVTIGDPRFKTGDDTAWASKNYVDTAWQTEQGDTRDQIYWQRITIEMLSPPPTAATLGLKINTFGAFDVYWDGEKTGSNGRVQTPQAREIPGTEASYYLIPTHLAGAGKHVLAVRKSQAYLSNDKRVVNITIAPYDQLLKLPIRLTSFMNIAAGMFLLAAVYYCFMFMNSRRRDTSILIFSLTCLLFFSLQMVEYIKFYIDIPYSHFYVRLEIIGGLTFIIALLIPYYFSIQFNYKRKAYLLGLLLMALVAIYILNFHHYDITALRFGGAMWLAAAYIAGVAVYQRQKSGVVVLAGLIISAVISYFFYFDISLYCGFCIIILCMLYLLTVKAKEAENEYRSSLLLSSRLKMELIKKNIQPHFIKNTLTSLIDWIEESPKQGIVFIQALSNEFELLNQISEVTLIPIDKEIALCKTHLTIMQFRKEVKYNWTEEHIDPSDTIPPAIIHTALENGITHSAPLSDDTVYFRLSFERHARYKQYTLTTIAKNRVPTHKKKTGTGFRYIKARLTESYGDNWEFRSTEKPDGWETIIKILYTA